MSIPHDDTIKIELLTLLASSPDERMQVRKVYQELAKLHPELTDREKNDPYQNSLSKWANRVQFARLHLVNSGMIYPAGLGPRPSYGVWIITDAGRKHVEQFNQKNVNSQSMHLIRESVAEILGSLAIEEEYFEGKRNERLSSYYERNPKLRAAAIDFHGLQCKACGFNFGRFYGEHGEGYIEVHHMIPVSTLSEETVVNPKTEMTVLCSNCHRMIHRRKNKPLTVEELQRLLQQE